MLKKQHCGVGARINKITGRHLKTELPKQDEHKTEDKIMDSFHFIIDALFVICRIHILYMWYVTCLEYTAYGVSCTK